MSTSNDSLSAGADWPDAARRALEGLRINLALAGLDEEPEGVRARIAVAPGRVNLLGGHTDYSQGYVLPAAVDRYTACALAETAGAAHAGRRHLRFWSESFDDRLDLDLDRLDEFIGSPQAFEELVEGEACRWRRYVAGVVLELHLSGHPIPAGIGVVSGDVPIGSGLSSSAALELAVHTALAPEMAPGPETALRCQRAENRWAGVPCGIMDQFASLMGREAHAIFLDCRDLRYRRVLLPENSAITVVDSGIRRELAESAYACRRREVETAVGILRKVAGPIESLRDMTPQRFEEFEDFLPEPLRRRARHVVYAIARVPEGVSHLALGEAEAFGRLMRECHDSLATQYEVSTPELDRIVSSACGVEGVLGARLTGAGFGGCCVVLHEAGCEEPLRTAVQNAFEPSRPVRLTFYHLTAADGAHLLAEGRLRR